MNKTIIVLLTLIFAISGCNSLKCENEDLSKSSEENKSFSLNDKQDESKLTYLEHKSIFRNSMKELMSSDEYKGKDMEGKVAIIESKLKDLCLEGHIDDYKLNYEAGRPVFYCYYIGGGIGIIDIEK